MYDYAPMKIKTKSGVDLRDLHPVMRIALEAASMVWLNLGHNLIITSTGEGRHSAGSMHPFGFAFDCRTWTTAGRQWPRAKRAEAVKTLNTMLPDGFQAIGEKTHIHVELDPVWVHKLFYPDISEEYFVWK